MKIRFLFTFGLLIALAFASTGCSSARKKKTSAGGADSDLISGSPLPDREEGVSFMSSNVDRNKFAPIHFGFDSYTVAPTEQPKVQQVAQFLRGGSSVIVAGFTDERGTPEYNRSLGEKRAQAVREAVIQAGGDASKLQTVSFGAEMPVDSASNEGAWAKNRRAEFGVTR